MTEAGSGSDAFGMKATAIKDGDDYIINANKLWITNAGHAGLFIVFANARPELHNENPKQVRHIYVMYIFKFLMVCVLYNVLSNKQQEADFYHCEVYGWNFVNFPKIYPRL